jgi:hypothetical protein
MARCVSMQDCFRDSRFSSERAIFRPCSDFGFDGVANVGGCCAHAALLLSHGRTLPEANISGYDQFVMSISLPSVTKVCFTLAVFSFWKKPVVETPLPVAATNHEAELVDALHQIDAARAGVGQSMLDFRRRSTAIVDGKLCYVTGKVTDRSALDKIWASLLAADSKLLQSRNQILQDLAAIRCPRVS